MLHRKNRPWAKEGICRPQDEPLFFSPTGQLGRRPAAATQAAWDRAKEICERCPVKNQCRQDSMGEEFGVFGGLDEYQRYQFRRAMITAMDSWPEERRLRWAERVYAFRQDGALWIDIQTWTGIPRQAGEKLLRIWTERLAALPAPAKRGSAPKVVDLPLPKEAPEFPAVPGRRHAWIRHRGIVADAWYRGETADGAWIYVTVQAGKGQSNKWIAAQDAKVYEPQAPVIMTYSARADQRAIKTHCAQGHPFSKENTRINGQGWRVCRACSNKPRGKKRQAQAYAQAS